VVDRDYCRSIPPEFREGIVCAFFVENHSSVISIGTQEGAHGRMVGQLEGIVSPVKHTALFKYSK
jgi:hypothetical protein